MYKKLADFYIEALLNQFNLIIKLGLVYYSFKEGTIVYNIKVTDSKEKALTFIDLDYVSYLKDFKNAESVFDFIIGSKYFNRHFFNELDLSSLDEEVQNEASKFSTYMHQVNAISKYKFPVHEEAYLYAVDYAFSEARLKQEVFNKFKTEMVNLPLEYKINPNLIKNWYPEIADDPDKVSKLLNEYIDIVQISEKFTDYLGKRTPHEVEVDFCTYVDQHIKVNLL